MSPGASPSREARSRSTSIRMVGWPSGLKTARSVMPGTRLQHLADLVGRCREHVEVVAEELDRVLALDAGGRLLDVVLDVLREVEVDTRKLLRKGRGQLLREFFLVDPGRPAVGGLEGYEEFRIEESGRIGAVIGPAMLRDHGLAPPESCR